MFKIISFLQHLLAGQEVGGGGVNRLEVCKHQSWGEGTPLLLDEDRTLPIHHVHHPSFSTLISTKHRIQPWLKGMALVLQVFAHK